jgi:hypothetical protein
VYGGVPTQIRTLHLKRWDTDSPFKKMGFKKMADSPFKKMGFKKMGFKKMVDSPFKKMGFKKMGFKKMAVSYKNYII